jgi:DNA-binding response OmpR family regulator
VRLVGAGFLVDDSGVMAGTNILVVEDHADLREMLAVLLETEGFEVQTASNGLEALHCLDEDRPRLILLDLMMPVMSGDEFRERQLADARYRDVPVICITAAHDGKDRARRIHAAAYFQKPVDFDRLLGAVRELAGAS